MKSMTDKVATAIVAYREAKIAARAARLSLQEKEHELTQALKDCSVVALIDSEANQDRLVAE